MIKNSVKNGTKSKKKKRNINMINALILTCLVLVACVSVGGVFAYFNSKSGNISGVINMGHLKVDSVTNSDSSAINWSIHNLQPNQDIGGKYKVTVDSNINYYLRVLFKANVGVVENKTHSATCTEKRYIKRDTDILDITMDDSFAKSSAKSNGYRIFYKLSPIKPTSNLTQEVFDVGIRVNSKVGERLCSYYMNANVSLNMQVEVIQADFLESQEEGKTFDNVADMNEVWNTISPLATKVNFYDTNGEVLTGTETIEDDNGDTYIVIPKTSPTKSKEIDGDTLYFQGWIKKNSSANIYLPNQKVSAEAGDEFVPYYAKDEEHPEFTFTKDEKTGEYILSGANINITTAEIPAFKQGEQITLIQNSGFYYYRKLETVTIPSTVIKIGDSAFIGCSKLTSITIPDSVTSIGNNAFYDCAGLTSVIIPDSVTSIGSYAFYWCGKLTSIIIPDSVTSIGDFAFGYCRNLTSINIPSSVKSIGSSMLAGCPSLTSLTVDSANTEYCAMDNILYSKDMKNLIFCVNTKEGTLNIPQGVESIKSNALAECERLTSISIPSSVTTITPPNFSACTNLTSLTVDSANLKYTVVDNILYSKDMTKLVACVGGKTGTVNIPSGVVDIENSAFRNCEKVTEVIIPDSVVNIYDYAFHTCNLNSISITNGVKKIGAYAFTGCNKLTSVYIPASVEDLHFFGFYSCKGLTTLMVDSNNPNYCAVDNILYSKDMKTLIACAGGKTGEVVIPEGVVEIKVSSFRTCVKISSITIASSVAKIFLHSFSNMDALTKVTFKNTSGWNVTNMSNFTGGTSIDVSNPIANATNFLTGDWYGRYLYRQ